MLPILVFAGALMCLANLLGLALFVAAHRRQASRQSDLLRQTRDDFQDAINQILDRYQELRAASEAQEDEDAGFEVVAATTPATSLAPDGEGLSYGKRATILRLYRQGESAPQIASAVGMPRAQVELLVKMHGWMSNERASSQLAGQASDRL